MEPAESLIDPALGAAGVPNHGIGRAMKVGKEEIMGLLVALERFIAQSDATDAARLGAISQQIARPLSNLPHACVTLVECAGLWPVVRIEMARSATRSAIEIARALENGTPPIYLATGDAAAGRLGIDPFNLQAGEAEIVLAALATQLS